LIPIPWKCGSLGNPNHLLQYRSGFDAFEAKELRVNAARQSALAPAEEPPYKNAPLQGVFPVDVGLILAGT
jgi:hypothetical protein